jgi:hypothetical protein
MRFPGNAGQSSGLSLPREEAGGQHPTSLAAREAARADSYCINSSPADPKILELEMILCLANSRQTRFHARSSVHGYIVLSALTGSALNHFNLYWIVWKGQWSYYYSDCKRLRSKFAIVRRYGNILLKRRQLNINVNNSWLPPSRPTSFLFVYTTLNLKGPTGQIRLVREILKKFSIPRSLKTMRNNRSSPHNCPIKKFPPPKKILLFMHN